MEFYLRKNKWRLVGMCFILSVICMIVMVQSAQKMMEKQHDGEHVFSFTISLVVFLMTLAIGMSLIGNVKTPLMDDFLRSYWVAWTAWIAFHRAYLIMSIATFISCSLMVTLVIDGIWPVISLNVFIILLVAVMFVPDVQKEVIE